MSEGFAPGMPALVERVIGDVSVLSVDARQLHAALGVATSFSHWIDRRISDLGLIDGEDYVEAGRVLLKSDRNLSEAIRVGRPERQVFLTSDAAKEAAMFERTDVGRSVRRYFIDCEKEFRKAAAETADAAMTQRLEDLEARLRDEFDLSRETEASSAEDDVADLEGRMAVVMTENGVLRARIALRDAEDAHAEAKARYAEAEASGIFGDKSPEAEASAKPGPSERVRRSRAIVAERVVEVVRRAGLVLVKSTGRAPKPGRTAAATALSSLVVSWGDDASVRLLVALKRNASPLAVTTVAIRSFAELKKRWHGRSTDVRFVEAVAALDLDAIDAATKGFGTPAERVSAFRDRLDAALVAALGDVGAR